LLVSFDLSFYLNISADELNKGTTAATWHGTMGFVKAASPFAYFQSAAMGGYGAPMMNGILRVTSLGSSTFAALWRSEKVKAGKDARKSKIKAKS
jgi:hypothetical protein